MEPYEKLELRKEITNEIREELTRSAGKLITRRILLALGIILFELLLWGLITSAVVQDTRIGQGILTCLFVCYLRGVQVWFICMFKGE